MTINSVLVTQVFPQRILPQWAQFIKKLRIKRFDSWKKAEKIASLLVQKPLFVEGIDSKTAIIMTVYISFS